MTPKLIIQVKYLFYSIGKLIGPQGQTQKIIEKRSGCRIAVRGRGANKKQKDIFQNFQPLHIIIVADND